MYVQVVNAILLARHFAPATERTMLISMNKLNRRLMQLRDFGRMRAHFGWLHFICGRIGRGSGFASSWAKMIQNRLANHTHAEKAAFDQRHGTETHLRRDVSTGQQSDGVEIRWGYSAICGDFLNEMLQSIPQPLSTYAFVDVGSGKGAGVLHASKFPFRRLCGIELTQELIEIAQSNVDKFGVSTGRHLDVDWIHGDFFQWAIPAEPQLFFMNYPFPHALNIPALEYIETSRSNYPRPTLLVFRCAPSTTANYLDQSELWRPIRLAPYWRVYACAKNVSRCASCSNFSACN